MTKKERLINLLNEGEGFLNKGLTYENKKFIAWNNSVIRFVESNYGKESTVLKQFKNIWFQPQVIAIGDDKYYYEECERCFNNGMAEILENLKRMIDEFDDYEAINDHNDVKLQSDKHQVMNINITNTNNNNIYIKSYNDVKNEVLDNAYLDDNSKKDLLEKLKEIEKLEASNDSKAKKWNTGKKILAYILDKGVDIAIAYIPLILQAISK